MTLKKSAFIIGLATLAFTTQSQAVGRLVVYCSTQIGMCEEETKAFAEKHDVKVSFIRNSAGSNLAKIEAEKGNPRADIWYGGTFDSHSQAAELGLFEAYQSPNLPQIMPKFRDPGKIKGNYTSSIYVGIMGFGVNTTKLAEKKLHMPTCWSDLTKPIYKGEIQIADPQSSGAAYTALATFVQLWGEDGGFEYFKKLNVNISQYTKGGIAPVRNTARGETTIGIGFLHDFSQEKENNSPVELIAPCEGTGYEIGGVSIIKGARNMDNAKLFIDWALSKEAQEISWQKARSYQILTNTSAEISPLALKLENLKLINYDLDTYGASDMRKYLISKWVKEVKMAE